MNADTTTSSVQLDHVGIDVYDLDAQVKFYCAAFDLTIEINQDLPEYRFKYVFLHSKLGWRLELFKREGTQPGKAFNPDTQHDELGIGHMALSVSNLQASYDRLISLGAKSFIAPSPSPDPSVQFAYLADPEGNLIELLDRSGKDDNKTG